MANMQKDFHPLRTLGCCNRAKDAYLLKQMKHHLTMMPAEVNTNHLVFKGSRKLLSGTHRDSSCEYEKS